MLDTGLKPYHWIITVQFENGATVTHDGSLDIEPGRNLYSTVYKLTRDYVAQVHKQDNLVVLYFDLTPNQL